MGLDNFEIIDTIQGLSDQKYYPTLNNEKKWNIFVHHVLNIDLAENLNQKSFIMVSNFTE